TSGQHLVVAGTDAAGLLHIRTFDPAGVRTDTYEAMEGSPSAPHLVTADASGHVLSDAPESSLPAAQAAAIAALKQQVPGLLPPHVLSATETDEVLTEATLITGHSLTGLPSDGTASLGSTLALRASVTGATTALQNAGFVDTWTVTFAGTTYGPYYGPNLNVTLGGVGTYAVTLTALDAEGVTASTTAFVNVLDTATEVTTNSSTVNATEGASSSFALGTATGPGLTHGSGKVLVNWGDGTSSSYVITSPGALPPAAHAYQLPGSFTVTVTSSDAYGLAGAGTLTANVAGVPPSPSILGTPTSPLPAGTQITLGSAVSDASQAEAALGFFYSWSVTKDGVAYTLPSDTPTNLESFSFDPTAVGTYVVNLKVTDHHN